MIASNPPFLRIHGVLSTLLLCLLAGCDSTSGDDNAFSGGVLATFDVTGESFQVWVTNEETIEQIIALRDGESDASIPNGPILRGAGYMDHNSPWSWHLDPEQTEMADLTIELCDGAPSYVEDHLDTYVEDVGRYCPWGAMLVDVDDYR